MNPMTDQYEYEDEDEYELEDEWEGTDYDDEWASDGFTDSDREWEDGSSPFDEATEMELAAELLSTTSDEELEEFLGSLAKKAWKTVKKAARSPVGRALTKQLRGLARRALPMAGRAVGGYLGGPIGASLGGKVASGAGRYFGLELEGLSPEDQEFEVARSVVRLAGEAAKQAAKAPAAMPPQAAASQAISIAAAKHAPGLAAGGPQQPSASRTGRWVRRGRNIILLNA